MLLSLIEISGKGSLPSLELFIAGKEIIELENVCKAGYSAYNVFDDWLDLMLYALMRNEDEYLKVVSGYNNNCERGNRPVDHFANAFGLLCNKMKETNDELLGEIYMTWNISNNRIGQFFTPKHIAKLIAEILSPSYRDKCRGL